MAKNKKIANATAVKDLGISFRSKSEERVYKKLLSLGYSPKYEPVSYVLWKGFRPTFPLYIDGIPQLTKNGEPTKFVDWKYTPDIILEKNGYTMIIEVKGYSNDIYPYKRKLFLKLLEAMDKTYFFEVHTIRGLLKSLEKMNQIWEQTHCPSSSS